MPRTREGKWLAVILLIALAVVVVAAVRSNHAIVVTQTRSVAPFTAVELAGSNLINVQVGATRSVRVYARQDMLNRVTTEVRAGTLVVADAPGHANTKGPMRVSVTVPALTSLVIAPTGSGLMNVSKIFSRTLTVALGGSGLVNASGITTHLTVRLTGSGDVELGGLTARDARVTVSGSGRAVVTATGSLDALMSGDGVIQYGGNPAHLRTSVTGSGAIIPG